MNMLLGSRILKPGNLNLARNRFKVGTVKGIYTIVYMYGFQEVALQYGGPGHVLEYSHPTILSFSCTIATLIVFDSMAGPESMDMFKYRWPSGSHTGMTCWNLGGAQPRPRSYSHMSSSNSAPDTNSGRILGYL